MPTERMRMRPWLEEQINSCQIPGLKWVNKVICTQRIMIIELSTKQKKEKKLFFFTVKSHNHFIASLLHKPSCCVDHIHTNCIMVIGEEDLPDPLDARCSSWLGLGERCSSLYEMGHTYRYSVAKSCWFFLKLHLQNTFYDKGLVVFKIEVWISCEPLHVEIPLIFISCFDWNFTTMCLNMGFLMGL